MGGKWLQTETKIHTEKLSTPEKKKVKILLKDNCGNKNNILWAPCTYKITWMAVPAQGWAGQGEAPPGQLSSMYGKPQNNWHGQLGHRRTDRTTENSLHSRRPAYKCLHLTYCILHMGLFRGHYTTLKAQLQKNVFNLRAKGPLPPIRGKLAPYSRNRKPKNLIHNRTWSMKNIKITPEEIAAKCCNYCTVITHI